MEQSLASGSFYIKKSVAHLAWSYAGLYNRYFLFFMVFKKKKRKYA